MSILKLNFAARQVGSGSPAGDANLIAPKIDEIIEVFTSPIQPVALVDQPTVTWNYLDGKVATWTAQASRSLVLSNVPTGVVTGLLIYKQGSAGGATPALPGTLAAGFASRLVATANAVSLLSFTSVPNGSGPAYVLWDAAAYGVVSGGTPPAPGSDGATVATAYASAMSAAGDAITTAQRDAIASWVNAVGGMYAGQAEVFPFLGTTPAGRAQGLKAAHQLTFFGNWIHQATGSLVPDSSTIATSTIVPSTALSVDSCSASVYLRTALTVDSDLFGVSHSPTQIFRLLVGSSSGSLAVTDSFASAQRASGSTANTKGLFSTVRSSATRLDLYKNGVSIGNNIAANTGTLPTEALKVGGMANVGGSNSNLSAGAEYAFLSFGLGRTAAQETIWRDATESLMVALGRNA